MKSTIKAVAAVAALALSLGLSACGGQEAETDSEKSSRATASQASDDKSSEAESDASESASSKASSTESSAPTGSASSSSSAKASSPQGGETLPTGEKVESIDPIVIKDQAIGLTQTCDKIVYDYSAPTFKGTEKGSQDKIILLHSKMEFSGCLLDPS